MEAIQEVIDLVHENEDLSETIQVYEGWFHKIVGKSVIYEKKTRSKKHTNYLECKVTRFMYTRGWDLLCSETDEVYRVGFMDFVHGRVYLKK